MALVDALEYIPQDHSGYADMIKWTKELAETLSKYQDKNGLWYQVIDQPSRTGNFPEASVTAQCMYAYMKAVNKGYIDSQYRAIAEKAFKGLCNKLLISNSDGTLTLTRCCQVGGLGTQTKLKYVPEQDTDFIFCTVGEEQGFVGSAAVLLAFLILILRLIFLSERQTSNFGRVYGYSVVSIFLFHLFINIGMVLGLTPVIGIPLPFFSYGGSSLWGFTILLFIFLRIDAGRGRRL